VELETTVDLQQITWPGLPNAQGAAAFPGARQLCRIAVVAFFSQLESVHLGWRTQPETGRRGTLVFVPAACGGAEK